jgi:hypothetical protein
LHKDKEKIHPDLLFSVLTWLAGKEVLVNEKRVDHAEKINGLDL